MRAPITLPFLAALAAFWVPQEGVAAQASDGGSSLPTVATPLGTSASRAAALASAFHTAQEAWLAAVHSMEAGADIEAYHNYPVAADAGDGKFLFVEIVPDFIAWGKMAEAYPDSAAAKADEAWGDVATCEASSLWASVKIE